MKNKTLTRWMAAALVGIGFTASAEAQHITIDGSLSPGQTLVGPNYTIGANLGKQVGGNLFESFGIFGLAGGESATFSGPASVTNVIGRVTGGSSFVDQRRGQIHHLRGKSLPHQPRRHCLRGERNDQRVGQLSRCDRRLSQTVRRPRFQATNPSGSTLSAAAPAAFGFLTAAPPAITVNGSTLVVKQGQTLGLVGGQISLTGATLQAPGGTLRVAGIASPGEVPVDPLNQAAMTVTSLAPISITQSSSLNVNNGSGTGGSGSVCVSAGALDDRQQQGHRQQFRSRNRWAGQYRGRQPVPHQWRGDFERCL